MPTGIDPNKAAEYGIAFYVVAILAVILLAVLYMWNKKGSGGQMTSPNPMPTLRCSDVLAVAINNNTEAMRESTNMSRELHTLLSTSMSTQNAKMDELLAHARKAGST